MWRMIDLFTGLAGFSLAASWVWDKNLEIVSMCEIDPRCRAFLSKSWPGVPIHDDIKTLDATQWLGTIDLLTGGTPCQPISCAGKRKGKEDVRWLWDETLAIVEIIRPTWCCFENPPAIRTMGLDGILSTLESFGYSTGTVDIPACAVNSPQLRHRYWILAHDRPIGRRQDEQERRTQGRDADRGIGARDLADTKINGIGAGLCNREPGEERGCQLANGHWDSHVWLPCADSKICRSPDTAFLLADGLLSEIHNELGEKEVSLGLRRSILGALGNSIVWPVAKEIMRAIKQAEEDGI